MIKDFDGAIVYLELSTWQGSSLGAIHWYAELRSGEKRVTLECTLTAHHAAILNKNGYDRDYYKPGGTHTGFLKEADAIRQAKKEWKGHFPNGRVLVIGKRMYLEPHEVLEINASDAVMKELNHIYDASKSLPIHKQWPFTNQWERTLASALGLEFVEWK